MALKVLKKSFSVGVKATANYNSVNLSEAVEIEVDENFNELDYAETREILKTKLLTEIHDYMKEFDTTKRNQPIKIDLIED